MHPAGGPEEFIAATTGLNAAEVEARRAAGLSNADDIPTSRTLRDILKANVATPFNAVVGVCFLALLLLGRWQDALFGAIALGNALLGFAQEYRAKRALDRLSVLNSPRTRVRRAGAEALLEPSQLVQDDILLLRPGDQVPVDARVRSTLGLQVDESLLSGESEPVDKHVGDEILSGSIVVAGAAEAVATEVGTASFAHSLAARGRRYAPAVSELRSSVDRVLRWIGWGLLPLALAVMNAQVVAEGGWGTVWRSGEWENAVVGTTAAVVAVIPLGLVLVTSLAFAEAAFRLARVSVLINDAPAVETLARIDVLCLDKTGTLTTGDIRLVETRVMDDAEGWQDALAWFGAAPEANATARCLAAAFPARGSAQVEDAVPFASTRRWSSVSFSGRTRVTWVLGAPDVLLAAAPVGSRSPTEAALAGSAGAGRRTLLLARSETEEAVPAVAEHPLPGRLRPVVVLAFAEDVRPDARQTLSYFREQGVVLWILSGDDARTALAVARRAGMRRAQGVDARDLSAVGPAIERDCVLGRVGPDRKVEIIRALQKAGHTVAMIGDGVNDVLAVRAADLGIAMGSGTAAVRAAARLVLLDNRFARLPAIVAEGRRVIANVERVSRFFLTKTVYASALAVVCGVFAFAYPFLPRQLSVTDGLTIGIPALLLAFLPAAPRYEPGLLRRSLRVAVPTGCVIAAAVAAFVGLSAAFADDVRSARAGATILLGVLGICTLAAAIRPLSPYRSFVVGSMLVGLVAVTTVPSLRGFFELVPLSPAEWAVLAALAVPAAAAIALVQPRRRADAESDDEGAYGG